ncbi:MAG TPA: 4Fe-4S binding protein [Desulfuromonadales bacterium]|nr:4Fe-4S binding protein [Desulfuromonadales bacterium]
MPARYVQPLRILVQLVFLSVACGTGFQFYRFVEYFRSAGVVGFISRPAGIESFLPISGLLGTASWLKGGGINHIHPAAMVAFLTVLAGALLLRRSFCSWICPVATISECSWKLGFKTVRRNWRFPGWLDIPLRSLKYLLLIFFVYSIAVAMSADELQRFIQSDYHKIADVRLLDFFLQISPRALTILAGILLSSLLLRNPFCRYLCPYGALLGLLAMLSPFRITRDEGRCVSCGVCSAVCPTHINVMQSVSVSSPECIGCWRCVSHCRFNDALSVRCAGRYPVSGIVFAALVVLLFWGGTQLGKAGGFWETSLTLQEYARLLGK